MKYHINITGTGAKIAYSSFGGLSFLLNGSQTRQHAIKPGRRREFGRRFSTFQITAGEQQLIFGKYVAFVFIQRENPIMTVNEAKHDPYLGAVSNGRLFYMFRVPKETQGTVTQPVDMILLIEFSIHKEEDEEEKDRERKKRRKKKSHVQMSIGQVLIIWQNAD